jgi:hypothetical protein
MHDPQNDATPRQRNGTAVQKLWERAVRLRLAAEHMQDANRACALRNFADLVETQAGMRVGATTRSE